MKKRKSWGFSFLFILIFMMAAVPVYGASKADLAKKAYNHLLSQKKITWNRDSKIDTDKLSFKVVDINGDKIPELYLEADVSLSSGPYRIYDYYNGKAREIDSNGRTYFEKCYPSKRVLVEHAAVKGVNFRSYSYVVPGKKPVMKLQFGFYRDQNYNIEKRYYKVGANGQMIRISKSTCEKELKKMVGNSKAVRLYGSKLHKNTAANRNKYLK